MRKVKLVLVAAVCLIATIAFPVSAMSPAEELARLLDRTDSALAEFIKAGYLIEHVEVDWLAEGQSYIVPIELAAGYDYKILGIGGDGIADLDIRVYDANKNLIAQDTLTDDVPEVDIKALGSGTIWVEIIAESLAKGASTDEYWYFSFIVGSTR